MPVYDKTGGLIYNTDSWLEEVVASVYPVEQAYIRVGGKLYEYFSTLALNVIFGISDWDIERRESTSSSVSRRDFTTPSARQGGFSSRAAAERGCVSIRAAGAGAIPSTTNGYATTYSSTSCSVSSSSTSNWVITYTHNYYTTRTTTTSTSTTIRASTGSTTLRGYSTKASADAACDSIRLAGAGFIPSSVEGNATTYSSTSCAVRSVVRETPGQSRFVVTSHHNYYYTIVTYEEIRVGVVAQTRLAQRTGFTSESSAQNACSNIRAQGRNSIPATVDGEPTTYTGSSCVVRVSGFNTWQVDYWHGYRYTRDGISTTRRRVNTNTSSSSSGYTSRSVADTACTTARAAGPDSIPATVNGWSTTYTSTSCSVRDASTDATSTTTWIVTYSHSYTYTSTSSVSSTSRQNYTTTSSQRGGFFSQQDAESGCSAVRAAGPNAIPARKNGRATTYSSTTCSVRSSSSVNWIITYSHNYYYNVTATSTTLNYVALWSVISVSSGIITQYRIEREGASDVVITDITRTSVSFGASNRRSRIRGENTDLSIVGPWSEWEIYV